LKDGERYWNPLSFRLTADGSLTTEERTRSQTILYRLERDSFYRHRCFICEQPMQRQTETQLTCGNRRCENALRRGLGHYKPLTAEERSREQALATISPGEEWANPSWRQVRQPNRSKEHFAKLRAVAVRYQTIQPHDPYPELRPRKPTSRSKKKSIVHFKWADEKNARLMAARLERDARLMERDARLMAARLLERDARLIIARLEQDRAKAALLKGEPPRASVIVIDQLRDAVGKARASAVAVLEKLQSLNLAA
jgi:hypothetical protein